MDKSHDWQCWADMCAIKQAIETSGYKTRKDVEGVIQALEGMQMKNSIGHPQGDKMLRCLIITSSAIGPPALAPKIIAGERPSAWTRPAASSACSATDVVFQPDGRGLRELPRRS